MSQRNHWSALHLLAALSLGAGLGAQADAAVARLRDPGRRLAAVRELQLAGPSGATAVLDALHGAATGSAEAELLAATIAQLGVATAGEIPRLVAAIERHQEPVRSHLLAALANGALAADDAAHATIRAAVPAWARQGWLYSPAADQPTFAWYEFVRLVRRMTVAANGSTPTDLARALEQLRQDRGEMTFVLPGGGAQVVSFYAIETHGAHGEREVLEAIAELALSCPSDVTAVVGELAHYLEHSPPRPPIDRIEHCAGIGENAPNDLPGAQWPTRWRCDAWHFACARAVFAHHREAGARQLALRHLLYADTAALRITALEAVRMWPPPWDAFADDLRAALGSDDRAIVRETLVTVGMSKAVAAAAAPELEPLAKGTDAELALLARRALALLR